MHFLKQDDYLPELLRIYALLEQQLSAQLPFAEIEHIGSSAIRGAISKGDLDILVRVPSNEFSSALIIIQRLGFLPKQNTLRTPSLCMLETSAYGTEVAIQLIERGSEFEMFVKFRDRLNADPKLVDEYNDLKRSMAGASADDYRSAKSKFIRAVLDD